MDFRGRMLESLSGVMMRDADGCVVAEGWMDFVITGEAPDSEPRACFITA
jgi:hypothetical protein